MALRAENPPEGPEVFVSNVTMSDAVRRAVKQGRLRAIGPKVYTRNLRDAPEQIVRRNLWALVGGLLPGALIADRSALALKPEPDGSLFVVAERKRDIALPGLVVRPRPGPPPLPTDPPFVGGLFLSSEARALLDNLAPSRGRGRARRTLTREELEGFLDERIHRAGVASLARLREEARRVAPALGRTTEFAALDELIGALQGTRDAPLRTERARARRSGRPFDPDRLELFAGLHQALRTSGIAARVDPTRGAAAATLAFFEAYFSNYIEGTKFTVAQAVAIALHNEIPADRPADAHDVVGTWQVVSDPQEMARVPRDAEELLELLRHRHALLMSARPDKHPGEFKREPNQAGETLFVSPERVHATLVRGFELYRSLESAFARAVFMKFLVAEVHPFADGNGRVSRIMMNAELAAAGERRILIPTIYRANYLSALKALSQGRDPQPLIRCLDFAQRWVDRVPWGGLEATTELLMRERVFMESADAEELGVRLRIFG